MALPTVPQLPTPSNTTTEIADFAKGLRDFASLLRHFAEHAGANDSSGNLSEGVSEETRGMLADEFFASGRGR